MFKTQPFAHVAIDLGVAQLQCDTPITGEPMVGEEADEVVHVVTLGILVPLLLMDNAANDAQVKPLIPPNGCLLLVTSRQCFVLPGLAPLNLNTLRLDRARELLLKICSRIADAGRL